MNHVLHSNAVQQLMLGVGDEAVDRADQPFARVDNVR
jgi:hypothetical protein